MRNFIILSSLLLTSFSTYAVSNNVHQMYYCPKEISCETTQKCGITSTLPVIPKLAFSDPPYVVGTYGFTGTFKYKAQIACYYALKGNTITLEVDDSHIIPAVEEEGEWSPEDGSGKRKCTPETRDQKKCPFRT